MSTTSQAGAQCRLIAHRGPDGRGGGARAHLPVSTSKPERNAQLKSLKETLRGSFGIRPLQQTSKKSVASASRGKTLDISANFLTNLFKGDPTAKTTKEYQGRVDQVNQYERSMQSLTDDELRAKTAEFQTRLKNGQATVDSVLPEAFAVVREASKRVLGLRPFDVQLMGGMILHEGKIAEMRTGEGKTLVAVLPAYVNALAGKGVHVVTVNDYLAKRDAEWVGQVHRFLGLQVGVIQAGLGEEERRAAYNCDVTYVTNSELGFDYLRDNLATKATELVQREFNFCVIDEVDSILIDEARTPLIISGAAERSSEKYIKAAKIAEAFERTVHYTVDEKQKSVLLSEEGYETAEDLLEVNDLYDPREQWASYLINAIKAKELQKLDVNYIVKGQEIIIVDEFSGRTMPGRRWGDGLHQAVEAKEGVEIQDETVTLASISYQSFFLSYPKVGGMTGTAATEVAEFSNIYKLDVAVVPTNRDVSRKDSTDVVFSSEEAKWKAVTAEVVKMHKSGRPVLVGTTSVERSELLATRLQEAGIAYQLLNAKPENVERESEIVAQSGRRGAVTISTNMAGRGTDILLGGNCDFMARLKLRELLFPQVVEQEGAFKSFKASDAVFPVDLSQDVLEAAASAVEAATLAWGESSITELEAEDRLAFACEKAPTEDPVMLSLRSVFGAMVAEYELVTSQERDEVKRLGGLHVVGTERHESRRIDNQLRGRAGRQGDPGSTRYFLSLEDNLFRIFGGDRMKGFMSQVGDMPLESSMLTRSLDEAQKKVETYFYDIREQLFNYDQVLNQQREKLYAERRKALNARDLTGLMVEYADETVRDIVEANLDPSVPPSEWDLDSLAGKMIQYCHMLVGEVTPETVTAAAESGGRDGIMTYLQEKCREAYFKKREQVEEEIEAGLMAEAEQYFVLVQTDKLWKEHLQAIKFIQQAVGLRGYAQKDPLTEYKLEGFKLFKEMRAQIRRNVIYSVYQFQPVLKPEFEELKKESEQNGAQGPKPNSAQAKQQNAKGSKKSKKTKAKSRS